MSSQSEHARRSRRRRRRRSASPCAWRAAQRGLRTLVLDAGEDGAWRYAAGMLAPVTEAEFGEDALLELGLRALDGFPAFCAELRASDAPACAHGTLVVARDRDEAEELERLLALPADARPRGRAAAPEPGPPRRARARADGPARARRPRRRRRRPARLVAALRRRGRGAPAARSRRERVEATVRRRALATRQLTRPVVVAAGRLVAARLGAAARPPGQGPDHAPARPARARTSSTRTIRTREGYLVPRGDGRYVLGATVEERGWDTAPTAGATSTS